MSNSDKEMNKYKNVIIHSKLKENYIYIKS